MILLIILKYLYCVVFKFILFLAKRKKMLEFLVNMDSLLRGFWYIALAASLVFVIQTVLTIIGGSGGDGVDADFDGDLDDGHAPFQFFSFRNLVNFLLGFGWGGIALYPSINNSTLVVVLAAVIGIGFILLYLVLIKQILKLSENNTFNIHDLVGKHADVYYRIPGENNGTGKVHISFKGTMHELKAYTKGEEIKTGEQVRIVTTHAGQLEVEKI